MRALARGRATHSFGPRDGYDFDITGEAELYTEIDDVDTSTTKYKTNLIKEEAPQHCTYPYVLRGYRSGGDYKQCLKAAFELHTETLNAWTMVAQGIISIGLFISVASSTQAPASKLVPFIALTSAVLVHMPFSVGFHLFTCMSKAVHDLWRRLDMTFIFLMSIPFTLAMSYNVYDTWMGVALNIGAAATVATLGVRHVCGTAPDVISEKHKLQVFLLVSSDAVIGSFPMVYQTALELADWNLTTTAACTLVKVALWQLGGWAYAHGFPEKYFPHVFDLVGSSHQLMHFAVVGAHILDYLFVWEMFSRRMAAPGMSMHASAAAEAIPVAACNGTVGIHCAQFAGFVSSYP